jgi:hypothetical protein
MEHQKYDFPTELLDLPSKGLVYPKDHPLSSGTIEIKYMTAKEEDILSNQNLIKKGVVLDKLFESIIVDKSINPNDITIGDKNAIIVATRLLGYGHEYKMSFYSSKLTKSVETIIDLSEIKTKDVDFSLFKNANEFEFTTPLGKNKIKFKLLTHGDENAIEKDITALERLGKDVSADITTRLRYMIISVDGKSEVSHINRFVNGMLAKDSRTFRNYIKSISPDMDMTFTYTHDDGETEALPITLGVGFFWPTE